MGWDWIHEQYTCIWTRSNFSTIIMSPLYSTLSTLSPQLFPLFFHFAVSFYSSANSHILRTIYSKAAQSARLVTSVWDLQGLTRTHSKIKTLSEMVEPKLIPLLQTTHLKVVSLVLLQSTNRETELTVYTCHQWIAV